MHPASYVQWLKLILQISTSMHHVIPVEVKVDTTFTFQHQEGEKFSALRAFSLHKNSGGR